MKIKTISKDKPWYGAGKMYGWKGAGIGVNVEYLNEYDVIELIVKSSKNPYYISTKRIKEISTFYKSYKTVDNRNGTYSNVAITPFIEWKSDLKEIQ